MNSGYTQQECEAFETQLNPPEGSEHKKLVDIWRQRNPELLGHYTYYSYRFKCREKGRSVPQSLRGLYLMLRTGIGWRLDYFVLVRLCNLFFYSRNLMVRI